MSFVEDAAFALGHSPLQGKLDSISYSTDAERLMLARRATWVLDQSLFKEASKCFLEHDPAKHL